MEHARCNCYRDYPLPPPEDVGSVEDLRWSPFAVFRHKVVVWLVTLFVAVSPDAFPGKVNYHTRHGRHHAHHGRTDDVE